MLSHSELILNLNGHLFSAGTRNGTGITRKLDFLSQPPCSGRDTVSLKCQVEPRPFPLQHLLQAAQLLIRVPTGDTSSAEIELFKESLFTKETLYKGLGTTS